MTNFKTTMFSPQGFLGRLAAFFFLWVANSHAQSSFTLDQCVEMAQKYSPQAHQLAIIREANKLQMRILNGANLPQSSLNGQASWQSEVTSIPIRLPNVEILPPPQDQYRITLDLTQNLWDGGLNRSQRALANASTQADEQKIKTDLYQLREQVANLFFGALLTDKQMINSELLYRDLANKIEKLRSAASNGTATKANILLLEARLVEIAQQQLAIQKQQSAALEGLSLLTGTSMTSTRQLQSVFADISESQEIVRPEVDLLETQKQVLKANESLIKAKFAPKLTAFATGGYGRPSLNFLSTTFNPYFIGGVQLRIPLTHLYTGGQTAEIRRSRLHQERLDKQKAQFLLATEVRLAAQKQELKRLEELLESDKKLIEMRAKLRQVAEVQLENGVITSADYLTELNNENVAKQNLVLHEIQWLQAKNNWKVLTGQ